MQVIVTGIALIVLIGLLTGLRWGRSRSVRVLLHGTGAAVFVAGLWIVGLLSLIVPWIKQFADWIEFTPFDHRHQLGWGVMAVGLVVVLVGFWVSPVSREEAKRRRQARAAAAKAPSGKAQAGNAVASKSAAAASTAPSVAPSAPSTEDAEVEELLRKHGIQ